MVHHQEFHDGAVEGVNTSSIRVAGKIKISPLLLTRKNEDSLETREFSAFEDPYDRSSIVAMEGPDWGAVEDFGSKGEARVAAIETEGNICVARCDKGTIRWPDSEIVPLDGNTDIANSNGPLF